MKIKHIVVMILSLLAALLLATAVIGTVFYIQSARNGEVEVEELPQSSQLELGKKFELQIKCDLPWGQHIANMLFTPGKGIIESGEIRITEKKFTRHGTENIISIPLKAYLTGELSPGTVNITVERPFYQKGTAKTNISKALAKINIQAIGVSDSRELPLAGELTQPETNSINIPRLIAIMVIILIALSVLAVWLIKKHRTKLPDIPIWETSLQELGDLKKTADSGERPLTWCVARLTDVVRKYLTKRFSWHTEQQTTEEFFDSIKGRKTPLTQQQINYLEDFMKSADLIKFANIRPERNSFDQALENAEDLIRETAENANHSNSTHSEALK